MIRKLYNSFKRILFKAYCPFCNGYWNEWLEHGFDYKILHEVKIIGGGKRNHECPNCSSTDRLRMIFSFLKQDDHVRIYSKSDYVAKLTKVGFKVNIISPYKKKLAYSPKKLGLNPKEELFIATK